MSERQPASLAFVDTETDGVHPRRNAWEVAVVRREPDGREIEWEAFVEIDLSTADPFGLRVGRFYDRHPLGRHLAFYEHTRDLGSLSSPDTPEAGSRAGVWAREAAAMRVAQLTHGAHVIGAVPDFDTGVLDRELRDGRLIPAWHYHLVDIENLAVGYLAGQGQPLPPPWSSDQLTAALGLDPTPDDERHTAMGDVRWAMRVYDRVMAVAAS